MTCYSTYQHYLIIYDYLKNINQLIMYDKLNQINAIKRHI